MQLDLIHSLMPSGLAECTHEVESSSLRFLPVGVSLPWQGKELLIQGLACQI